MAAKDEPVVIKKYANRRLYNTGTSTYVTLEDLAEMVKSGEDFTVQDAKTGDDITHPVLTQIIFELENKDGQNMLPIPFLRQLISFYGDQMQMVVPSFLEQSMIAFAKEQERFREQMKSAHRQVADGHDEDADADQGDRGAGAAQHRDVPERHAHVHALPAGRRSRPAPAEPSRKEPADKSDDLAGAQGPDRRDAAQARLDGVTRFGSSTLTAADLRRHYAFLRDLDPLTPPCAAIPGGRPMTELHARQGQRIIAMALSKAADLKFKPLGVVVLDAGGHPVALQKQDGASMLRTEIASGKAYGALAVGTGSRALSKTAIERPHFFQGLSGVSGGKIVPVPGGVLIRAKSGAILGAVGFPATRPTMTRRQRVAGIEAAGFTAEG